MSDRTSIPMTPSRRVLAALALFALALAAALAAAPSPANAAAAAKKPSSSPASPLVSAKQAPDRSTRRAPSAAATQALATIQRRIADHVATHGTKYTFASYLDSAGKVVVDTNAPASVVSGLTRLSSASPAPSGRQRNGPSLHHP